MTAKISVIIPAYDEKSVIYSTLEDLFSRHQPDEVIVVDGGSTDNTIALAKEWTTVIRSEKGRARQMNEGAWHATGDIFLFLHADTKLPDRGLEKIKEVINHGREAGRFQTQFDENHYSLRFYASYSRFHFFSYGDQGFFVTKELFEKLGGFDEAAPFEDIDFYRRLRQMTRPVIIGDAVITSARRFIRNGCIKQKFVNLFLVALYYLGFNVLNVKEKLYPEVR